jgi:GWxTD domain-containing protein
MSSKKVNDEDFVNGALSVKISSVNNDVVYLNKKYSFEQKLYKNQTSLTGQLNYSMSEGEYLCELKGEDLNRPDASDSVSFVFGIKGFDLESFSMSDIQFASSIIKSENKASQFYKNNYEVVPNPSGIFGESLPVLYFYSELYNLDRNVKSDYLDLNYNILNPYNENVYSKKRKFPKMASSIVVAEAINVSKFPSGSYTMSLVLSDSANGTNAQNVKRFTIVNPAVEDTHTVVLNTEVMSSEFMQMDADDLEKVFQFSRYIATKKEKEVWALLSSLTEKRNFLFDFWKRRDEDPNTPINKYKNDFFERVEIAAKRFENINTVGWKTDRGRVFCIYGEPDEIERYPNEEATKPYEIWSYYGIEGGVTFVFAELFGFSDMNLIHSTKIGELSDPNWRRKIAR